MSNHCGVRVTVATTVHVDWSSYLPGDLQLQQRAKEIAGHSYRSLRETQKQLSTYWWTQNGPGVKKSKLLPSLLTPLKSYCFVP